MRDHVRFRSDQFAPPDREPWQVGGERFGYALATWVSAALAARGFDVGAPVAEDWGWLLGVSQDGQVVRIGCGNVEGSLSEFTISSGGAFAVILTFAKCDGLATGTGHPMQPVW